MYTLFTLEDLHHPGVSMEDFHKMDDSLLTLLTSFVERAGQDDSAAVEAINQLKTNHNIELEYVIENWNSLRRVHSSL